MFNLGFAMISWFGRKKTFFVLSTEESEYISTCSTCYEVVWLRKFFVGLFDQVLESTIMYYDNHSCVKISKNLVFHNRSKHIEIKYHYICNIVQKGVVRLKYVSIDEQVADFLTKPLSQMKFYYF